ncbi:MAG: SH3 domain-containing protein [Phototrophicaceae bacterium]
MKRLIIFILLGVMLAGMLPSAFAQSTGTVTAYQLNVRTAPDPIDGIAVSRIYKNETYSVIGRTDTAHWFQIQLPNGTTGWVSGAYFRVIDFSTVPVTFSGYVQGTVLSQLLNIRTAPNTSATSLGKISRGQTYRVLGKNAAGTWYQLRLPSGITGWVSGQYLLVTNAAVLPITG